MYHKNLRLFSKDSGGFLLTSGPPHWKLGLIGNNLQSNVSFKL